MKTFIVILSDIPNADSDMKFSQYVFKNKFEWWRYTALAWIIATPNSIKTTDIHSKVQSFYNGTINCVLEVDINSWAGFGPVVNSENGKESFLYWFRKIKDKTYKPSWER